MIASPSCSGFIAWRRTKRHQDIIVTGISCKASDPSLEVEAVNQPKEWSDEENTHTINAMHDQPTMSFYLRGS